MRNRPHFAVLAIAVCCSSTLQAQSQEASPQAKPPAAEQPDAKQSDAEQSDAEQSDAEQQSGSNQHDAPPPDLNQLDLKKVAPDQQSQVDRTDFPAPVHDDQWFWLFRAEQLEYRYRDGFQDMLRWDVQAWLGGDYRRLWVKTEGEQSLEGKSEGEFEFQALFSQVISSFWNLQAGVRYDRTWGPGPDVGRGFGVLALQGFAPYEFEVDLSVFLSEEADVSLRLTATTDFLISQRLILQPRIEIEGSLSKVRNLPIGRGVNYFEVGTRLRYELMREIAPYVGVNWRRALGGTAGLVRRDGGVVSDFSVVAGVAFWF